LLVASFITFFCLNSKSQNKPGKSAAYDRGYYFNYYDRWDSAFFWFNHYVNNPDDTLKKGKAYNYMGQIQWRIGDLYGAQESLTNAIKTLDPLSKENHTELRYTYNLLGNISLDLGLYDEALGYYDNAIFFAKGTDYIPEVMNGKATAFQRKQNYKDAIAIYDSILALKPGDQDLVARVIDNRARTKWLQNSAYPALPEFYSALNIRIDSQYNVGLNASYAHLSDYYVRLNPDSAFYYAQKMREKAVEIKSPDDILEAVDKLIRLSNSSALMKYWYGEFKRLSDSIQFSRDTTRSRFASIRFGAAKSKADNLTLQQHITKQRVLTVGIVIMALALITALLIWFRRRRQKLKQESENAIRESKLKTSQKVHDVVANGLYTIMNELEHADTPEKEPLLNKIENLYEKSRNISYEDLPVNSTEYDKQIHQLLNSFTNEHTKVFAVGNQQTFWNKITASQKHELQLVLNEIMINMQKHSGAKNVVIHFKQENKAGFINYKDDGVGFRTGVEFGNGLNNTVSRIRSLNGQITFEKSSGQGVSIAISFPLELL
jgi:signal transduction histidine kinase